MKKLSLLVILLLPAAALSHAQQIQWLTWEQAAEKMAKSPRKIMVDVYTDWCGWCKKMDALTMTDPAVIKILNEHYYAVKLDGEYKKDIVWRGNTFKFVPQGGRGYHELAAALMDGKMSYPTLVFLNEKYELLQAIPGFQQGKDLEPILAYFAGNHFVNTDWKKFSEAYQPVFPR